ncbi:MAG: hypothetical protein ACP5QA_02625 [Phycisphaerae bacterium]
MRAQHKSAFGDFQTPIELAKEVCAFLRSRGTDPKSIVEPTCGIGNILRAAIASFPNVKCLLGVDISDQHVAMAKAAITGANPNVHIEIISKNFFHVDWWDKIRLMPRPLLMLGNPPWVTNSHLGVLGSDNLPLKSNIQQDGGLDAITGKANFDISEWMLMKMAQCLGSPETSMAMLCKTSVARKVLSSLWKSGVSIALAEIVLIDALWHFDAAVDACLLHIRFGSAGVCDHAKVYSDFSAREIKAHWGFKNGMLLANVELFNKWQSACTGRKTIWRSGIKHDCSAVIEMESLGRQRYRNGLDEICELEDTYIYPMLKSSHLNKGEFGNTNRVMLVPQEFVGDDTARIADSAPLTWGYLQKYAHLMKKRGSLIYKNRPAFSVFGVGPYSFAPWKVATSALYKKIKFVLVGPREGKPYVFDDTCYFLSCKARAQAELLTAFLNSESARQILESLIFWDAKRPITVEILERIDLEQLAVLSGADIETITSAAQCTYAKLRKKSPQFPRDNLFSAVQG